MRGRRPRTAIAPARCRSCAARCARAAGSASTVFLLAEPQERETLLVDAGFDEIFVTQGPRPCGCRVRSTSSGSTCRARPSRIAQAALSAPRVSRRTRPRTWPEGRRTVDAMRLASRRSAVPARRRVVDTLRDRHPSVLLSGREDAQSVTLERLVVPEGSRGCGLGSAVMRDLVAYADRCGKQVRLTPSGAFGGRPRRLASFYARFGFVPNEGERRDPACREGMYRNPRTPSRPR